MFCQSGGVQTRRVLFLPIRKGKFLPIRRVPIRRGPVFANPKGSSFPNPEGSQFGGSCLSQSRRVIFCQSGGVKIRKGAVFTNPLGFHWNRLVEGLAVYLTN